MENFGQIKRNGREKAEKFRKKNEDLKEELMEIGGWEMWVWR